MLEVATFKTESLNTDGGNVVINSVGTSWFLLLDMKRPRPEPGSFHLGANGDFIPAATSRLLQPGIARVHWPFPCKEASATILISEGVRRRNSNSPLETDPAVWKPSELNGSCGYCLRTWQISRGLIPFVGEIAIDFEFSAYALDCLEVDVIQSGTARYEVF
jgi:hypothetical protein